MLCGVESPLKTEIKRFDENGVVSESYVGLGNVGSALKGPGGIRGSEILQSQQGMLCLSRPMC